MALSDGRVKLGRIYTLRTSPCRGYQAGLEKNVGHRLTATWGRVLDTLRLGGVPGLRLSSHTPPRRYWLGVIPT